MRDHIGRSTGNSGRSTGNSNPVMTSSTGGAKGCSAYAAQLLTLHQHNQYRTLKVSSNTQAALEQSPFQVLPEPNIA